MYAYNYRYNRHLRMWEVYMITWSHDCPVLLSTKYKEIAINTWRNLTF